MTTAVTMTAMQIAMTARGTVTTRPIADHTLSYTCARSVLVPRAGSSIDAPTLDQFAVLIILIESSSVL
jgi:hypothetical protein